MTRPSAPSRALVTGASGFIGTRLVSRLSGAGVETHAVTRQTVPVPGAAQVHATDVLDATAVTTLLREVRPTHLIHLAWTTAHGTFWHDPANLDWAAATMNLVRCFHRMGGERAVLIGSCAEYDWTQPGPYAETDAGGIPHTLYGAAKLGTSIAAVAYGAHAGLDVVWARLFHLYGLGEAHERLVPQLMAAAASGERLEIHHPSQAIDLLHVDDVARALVELTTTGPTGVVNLGSGVPTRLGELGAKVAALAGLGAVTPEADRDTSSPRVVADIGRLRDEVHYQPARTLDDGLREIWDQRGDQMKEKL